MFFTSYIQAIASGRSYSVGIKFLRTQGVVLLTLAKNVSKEDLRSSILRFLNTDSRCPAKDEDMIVAVRWQDKFYVVVRGFGNPIIACVSNESAIKLASLPFRSAENETNIVEIIRIPSLSSIPGNSCSDKLVYAALDDFVSCYCYHKFHVENKEKGVAVSSGLKVPYSGFSPTGLCTPDDMQVLLSAFRERNPAAVNGRKYHLVSVVKEQDTAAILESIKSTVEAGRKKDDTIVVVKQVNQYFVVTADSPPKLVELKSDITWPADFLAIEGLAVRSTATDHPAAEIAAVATQGIVLRTESIPSDFCQKANIEGGYFKPLRSVFLDTGVLTVEALELLLRFLTGNQLASFNIYFAGNDEESQRKFELVRDFLLLAKATRVYVNCPWDDKLISLLFSILNNSEISSVNVQYGKKLDGVVPPEMWSELGALLRKNHTLQQVEFGVQVDLGPKVTLYSNVLLLAECIVRFGNLNAFSFCEYYSKQVTERFVGDVFEIIADDDAGEIIPLLPPGLTFDYWHFFDQEFRQRMIAALQSSSLKRFTLRSYMRNDLIYALAEIIEKNVSLEHLELCNALPRGEDDTFFAYAKSLFAKALSRNLHLTEIILSCSSTSSGGAPVRLPLENTCLTRNLNIAMVREAMRDLQCRAFAQSVVGCSNVGARSSKEVDKFGGGSSGSNFIDPQKGSPIPTNVSDLVMQTVCGFFHRKTADLVVFERLFSMSALKNGGTRFMPSEATVGISSLKFPLLAQIIIEGNAALLGRSLSQEGRLRSTVNEDLGAPFSTGIKPLHLIVLCWHVCNDIFELDSKHSYKDNLIQMVDILRRFGAEVNARGFDKNNPINLHLLLCSIAGSGEASKIELRFRESLKPRVTRQHMLIGGKTTDDHQPANKFRKHS